MAKNDPFFTISKVVPRNDKILDYVKDKLTGYPEHIAEGVHAGIPEEETFGEIYHVKSTYA